MKSLQYEDRMAHNDRLSANEYLIICNQIKFTLELNVSKKMYSATELEELFNVDSDSIDMASILKYEYAPAMQSFLDGDKNAFDLPD